MAAEDSKFVVHLECSALKELELRVLEMHGREHLSQPFEYRLVVRVEHDVPLIFEDIDALFTDRATISFGPEREYPIHGVVRDVRLLPIADGAPTYELTVVPRFLDYQLTRGSWIYQDKTIQEIVTAAFALPEDDALKEGDDFEFLLDGTYNPREYVVQYEESALNFIQRQAEHWGIYYFFDHLGDTDRIVFGDVNSHFPSIEGFEEVVFDPRLGVTLEEVVLDIGMRQRMVERDVSLRDHNYRIPSVGLVTPLQGVDPAGMGTVHVTGDHFWTPEEGAMLAAIRSQELFSHKRRMEATTTVRGMRAGHRFTLVGETPESLGLARDYLVVSVQHRFGGDGLSDQGREYSNVVELLPYELAFKPPRITHKPRIYGVMHATVDAEADDDEVNVPVDEWGRYKVVMPFDVAGEKGGKSSCWIRNVTQAGGGGWGFAQGLHVGTEVVIVHIDGDPDRPVIAGAVMNFEQPASVTNQNANQLNMSSRQGIKLVFNDA